MEPLQVSVIHHVIYIDDSRCSESVCALPLDVEAREPVSGSDGWSFLLQYDPTRARYQLLGLGGDDVTNGDGIWGFSWLPQLITSSVFANNGSCFKRGDFPWVVLDALSSFDKGGERIKIKKKIPHPRHVTGTHWYDFMLVELDKPTSRTPIGFVDTNTTFSETTVFAYGESFGWSQYVNTYDLRSTPIHLYTLRDCSSRIETEMDESMACGGIDRAHVLCPSDNGGAVVIKSGTESQQLYAVVSGSGDCGRMSDYGIVSVIYSVADWVHAYLDQKT
ncbi:hypothetical protein Poli38472_011490 [Pythium oligandrum]|uniref:Peptidase S1 domain-containing protein n=1 Tax=Pythium oligandrum TaxID=41045 RepID=A0A8K1CL12_PYTOL|nr:hypothetical protein Poli38472_011490 [Pythium oligandrum]|eukprot:TMW64610.1 hypothetical protein Poli38472_011490 [Pythium oligandrum]